MNDNYETVYFPTRSKMLVGGITYIIKSHFDEKGGNLKDKIKNLLIDEINNYSNVSVLNSRNM